jgi:hypothetical protein
MSTANEKKRFALIDAACEDHVLNAAGQIQTFDSGKLAKEAAGALSEARGIKYKVRPYVEPDYSWKAREEARFASGEYRKVLPGLQYCCSPEHYVHVSAKDPLKLAYTRNAFDGAADKQKQISVRGYLETFQPNLPACYRKNLIKEHERYFTVCGLKFAYTPDEIEEVYTNYAYNGHCTSSCMRHDSEHFSSHAHPVRVYGAGDLAVAYITDSEGRTVERALCWPDRKIYSRVYGTDKLHDMLRAAGYEKSTAYYKEGNNRGLEGARLLRIKDNYRGSYHAPYCDDIEYMSEYKDERYFVLDPEGEYYYLQDSDARGLTGPSNCCEYCEECCDDLYTVNTSNGTQEWCESCRGNYTFYCHGTHAYYSEHSYESTEVDGDNYESSYADNHFHFCDSCEEWTTGETVEVKTPGSTQDWCTSCATDDAFRCIVDGMLYDEDLAAPGTIRDGTQDAEDKFRIGRYIGNIEPDTPPGEPYRCLDPAQLPLPNAA